MCRSTDKSNKRPAIAKHHTSWSAGRECVLWLMARMAAVCCSQTTTTTHINDMEDFVAWCQDPFGSATSGTNIGGEVVLHCDLVFGDTAPELVPPLGSNTVAFVGVFDGNGHTIRNLVVNTTSGDTGLFVKLEDGAVVKNLV